jgi:acyl-[acyl-carrier-protein] desaturase
MTSAEKDRKIQRAMHGLYRWYLDRSQKNRDWNPDRSFAWNELRQDHSENILHILTGFYAVEQYTPDYTSELVRLTRKNYGRGQFQLRWGAEEEKHADLWRNAVLFSGHRSARWLEDYTEDLRSQTWVPPFTKPAEMLIYTVVQERATQLNYMKLRERAVEADDPVLAAACRAIAIDEAAHYDFFLEGARLYLYYYPEESLIALVDVLRNFTMPASEIIPNYDGFITALYEESVFGRLQYAREVVPVALKNLGVPSLKAIEKGLCRTREVPDPEGKMRGTAIWGDLIDQEFLEGALIRLFEKVESYQQEIGLDRYVEPLTLD